MEENREDERGIYRVPANKPLQVEVTLKKTGEEKPAPPKNNFADTIKTALSLVGIFAALCYLLGRFYLASFYHALGMSTAAMTFGTNDYMFSSLIMVIVCLIVCVCIYVYWLLTKHFRQVNRRIRRFGAVYFGLIILVVWGVCLCILLFSRENTFLVRSGLTGGSAGLVIGIPIFMLALNFGIIWKKQERTGRPAGTATGGGGGHQEEPPPGLIGRLLQSKVVWATLLFLYLGIFIPIFSDIIAESRANCCIVDSQRVIVIGKKAFSPAVPLSITENSTEGKFITTNNGNTYILSPNADDKKSWRVFAIPVADIETVIYIHEVSDNASR
jgi:hypothetical protein